MGFGPVNNLVLFLLKKGIPFFFDEMKNSKIKVNKLLRKILAISSSKGVAGNSNYSSASHFPALVHIYLHSSDPRVSEKMYRHNFIIFIGTVSVLAMRLPQTQPHNKVVF